MRLEVASQRRSFALAALCAVLFLTFLDNTIVSVALADIQTDLFAGVSSLQWIVDGYMLAFTALMLTGGTLGDLLGRKRVLLTGIVLWNFLAEATGNCVNALVAREGLLRKVRFPRMVVPLSVSLTGLIGFLDGGDRVGILVGYSQKLTPPIARAGR